MNSPELFRPTRPFHIGQGFGQNEACVSNNYPYDKTIVAKTNGQCPVGFREFYPLVGLKGHSGLDCYAPTGTPLYACQRGTVIEVSTEEDRGLGIDVVTDKPYDIIGGNFYLKYRYWHLKGLNVVKDQHVEIGDLLGWADNTGRSAGSHLHWEVKPVVIQDDGTWKNAFQNNGYYGAVNFERYVSNLYAKEIPGILEAAAAWIKRIAEGIERYFANQKNKGRIAMNTSNSTPEL